MPIKLCRNDRNPAVRGAYCLECARRRDRQATKANKHIYNSRRWRILRRQVLIEQPICASQDTAAPHPDCTVLSEDVHHIKDIQDGGPPFDRGNLEAHCHGCHSRITRARMATQAT